jgi:hypothetical protein
MEWIKVEDRLPEMNSLNEIQQNSLNEIVRKRDEFIRKAIEEKGFPLDSDFLSKNGEIKKHDNKYCELFICGKLICSWWDTFKFDDKGNSFNIIYGEPQKMSKPVRTGYNRIPERSEIIQHEILALVPAKNINCVRSLLNDLVNEINKNGKD